MIGTLVETESIAVCEGRKNALVYNFPITFLNRVEHAEHVDSFLHDLHVLHGLTILQVILIYILERDSPAPKASDWLSAKREPRRSPGAVQGGEA